MFVFVYKGVFLCQANIVDWI